MYQCICSLLDITETWVYMEVCGCVFGGVVIAIHDTTAIKNVVFKEGVCHGVATSLSLIWKK